MADEDPAVAGDVTEEAPAEVAETPSASGDVGAEAADKPEEDVQEPVEVATEDAVETTEDAVGATEDPVEGSATVLEKEESVVEEVQGGEQEGGEEGAETLEGESEGIQEAVEEAAEVKEGEEGEVESGEVAVDEEKEGGESEETDKEEGVPEEDGEEKGEEEEKEEVNDGEEDKEGEKEEVETEEKGDGEGEEVVDKEEGVEGEEKEAGEEEEDEHKEEEPVGDEEAKEEGESEEVEASTSQQADDEGAAPEGSDGGMHVIVEEGDDVSDHEGPHPAEFIVRPKQPLDEFSLDPDLDENELQFVLPSPSDGSISIHGVAAPVVEAVKADAKEPSVESVQAPVDRETYYENHRAQTLERASLTRRNAVLQRKLMDHFKKRKMNEVFRETDDGTPEMVAKYTKKLAIFGELKASYEATRRKASAEIEAITAEEARLVDFLQDALDSLVAAERETATSLLDNKSGKVISEKLVERLLRRQRDIVKELGETRLIYIKARDKVTAKEEAIKTLEDLGQNLSMLDYEQLRMENQNLTDKIEERDEDMARLRARAMHSAQALTHYKEKMCMVVGLLDKQLAMLRQKECELGHARTELNSLKVTRDRLRADFVRESELAGLLTKPQLLRDFEETLDARDDMRAQLEQLQAESAAEKEQLTVVREAVGRSAGVEVEIKPKRTPFIERAQRKVEQQKKRVRVEAKQSAESEEVFQM